MGRLNLYVPFTKVDPEQRIVGGWATVEEPDRQRKVVDFDSAAAALMAWGGNMREMHQPLAVGKAVAVRPEPAQKRVWLESFVSRSADGENTWTKIQEGILTGYSIAGSLAKQVPEIVKDAAGKIVADARQYVETINEVSYVDLPAAPSAVYAFTKSDGTAADFLADLPSGRTPGMEQANTQLVGAAIAKGWLPAGTTPADLDDGDFAWLSDAYEAGDESATEGRKLPYKIHGEVDPDGWQGAWTRVHQMSESDFSGGPSKQDVIDKLLTDKPEDVEVSDDAKQAAAQPTDLKKGKAAAKQPAEPVAQAAPAEPVAKSASDDIVSADMAVEMLARLIEHETGEGDSAQVGPLQQALALVQQFAGMESEELSEPDNAQEAQEEEDEAEEAAEDMGGSAIEIWSVLRSELAKRAAAFQKLGARNSASDQANLNEIHDLSVAAGAYPDDHNGSSETPATEDGTAKAVSLSAESIAKAVTAEFAKSAPYARPSDVAAIEERLLKAIEPMQEQISKIAALPAPGGPVRMAVPGWQESAPASVTEGVSAAIAKIASDTTDPKVREALQQQAAALDIQSTWKGAKPA